MFGFGLFLCCFEVLVFEVFVVFLDVGDVVCGENVLCWIFFDEYYVCFEVWCDVFVVGQVKGSGCVGCCCFECFDGVEVSVYEQFYFVVYVDVVSCVGVWCVVFCEDWNVGFVKVMYDVLDFGEVFFLWFVFVEDGVQLVGLVD